MIINIPITTNKDKIFKQYLNIINTLLSKDKRLTELEIEVLDKMIYIDNLYKHLDKDKRDKIIFNFITKKRIMESVYNLSKYSYNNIITSLRRKGIIAGKSLKIKVPDITDGKIEINFKLNIE